MAFCQERSIHICHVLLTTADGQSFIIRIMFQSEKDNKKNGLRGI